MKSKFALLLLFVCSSAWGDSLQLRNGSLIRGTYLGGSGDEIRFQVGTTVQSYAVADVAAVTFDDPTRPSGRNEEPQAPLNRQGSATESYPTSSRTIDTIKVPSGTRILVRTIDAIDSDHNQIGDRFKASLEQPLVVDDVLVAPRGADVYGRLTQATEAGRVQGRSQLRLELTGIVVNGQTTPLFTGDYSVAGKSRSVTSAQRIGGGAAVGAVIGAIAGGGKGAAIGAGVGAGAGTAVQVMTKGEQVHVPSETLLEFVLQQDVRIPVTDIVSQARR